MTIRGKTAIALLGIFITLLCGAWLILQIVVLPRFEHLEAQTHARDAARVEANLTALARTMQSRTSDYAQWSDTYTYIEGRNPGYISANFTEEWFPNYDVDFLAFADDQGRILWTNAATNTGGMRPELATTSALIADAQVVAPPSGVPIVGVIWTGGSGGPMLYSAARATKTDGSGPPLGLVIIGKRLTQEMLHEQVQLDLQLIDARTPTALATRMAALQEGTPQTWIENQSTQSLLPMRNAHGQIVGAVLAKSARDITALGGRALLFALILFAGMCAVVVAAMWLLLRTLVIARLKQLERHMDAQSAAAEPMPAAAAESHDEIGRLTDAYNAMIVRLREAGEREQAAVLEREAAATANRMKSDFLANISHELRTPLNAVIGYAELIEEELTDEGVIRPVEDLHRIRGAARHLLSLINEILDLSKIEAGRLEITPASFRVEDLLRGVVDTISPLAKQNGNTLKVTYGDNLGNAYSDELRLRQSLINVLSNACKFTNGGTVSLDVRRLRQLERERDILRFEVRDTGIGMSEEQLHRVFEPFVQADPSISRRFGGTGLGLAITRKIVALLGGDIRVTSVQGEGTAFILTTPVVATERALSSNENQPRESADAA